MLSEGKKEAKRKRLHTQYRSGVFVDSSSGSPIYSCKCPAPGCGRIHGQFKDRKDAFRNRECRVHRLKTFEKLKKEVQKSLHPQKRNLRAR